MARDRFPEGSDTPLEEAVVAVLRALEPGDVVTYGEVALEAGWPGRSRAVGRILSGSGMLLLILARGLQRRLGRAAPTARRALCTSSPRLLPPGRSRRPPC